MFILVFHTGMVGEHGYFGVDILFVISGYVIMLSTEKNTDYFLTKRIIRVIPLYWLITFFTFIILRINPTLSIMSVADIKSLIYSLFFIPHINPAGFDTPLLAVGWTLNYEIYFYLIFFLAVKISHKYRLYVATLLLIFMTIAGKLFADIYIISCLGDTIIWEFILGMFLYLFFEKFNIDKIKISVPVNGLISLVLIIYLFIDPLYSYTRSLVLGVPALLLVFFVKILFNKKEIAKILVITGNISYSFYFIAFYADKVFYLLSNDKSLFIKITLLLVAIIITWILSYISFQIIEVKLTNSLKKIIIKKDNAQ